MTFFFYGPNSYALRAQLGQMIGAYLKKAGSDFGLDRLDGSQMKARDLLAALQASPFLASSRLVIIEGLAANKVAADQIPKLLAGVPASTVAVFVEREIDQRTTAFKKLLTADKVMKFEPLPTSQLIAWSKQQATTLGGDVERPALQELIDLVGPDQWRLEGEINKLVNYDATITVDTVRKMVVPSVEHTIFDLVEAMSAGRAAAALASYHQLLKQKESEIGILVMIQWQLRNLLLAKTAPAMSPADLAKTAGMSPYVAGKMAGAAKRLELGMVKNAYAASADCEYYIKSGRIKAETAVEQLIYRVAAAAQP